MRFGDPGETVLTKLWHLIRDAGIGGGGIRFALAGLATTAATMNLYWILLQGNGYQFSYTFAYVIGIALSYALNAAFVFKVRVSLKSAVLYPLVYLVQYLVGLLTLWVWVDLWNLSASLGVIAAIVISIPVTFFFSRKILHGF